MSLYPINETLSIDELGELRHAIVDGKIEYKYGYNDNKKSKIKIEVDYQKLIEGNQKYIDLGIK